jgi:hypothetical protein
MTGLNRYDWAVLIDGVLVGLSLVIWAYLGYRKYTRLGDANFLLCPRCKYELKGLPDRGRCPECGMTFASLADVREYWYRDGAEPLVPEKEHQENSTAADEQSRA